MMKFKELHNQDVPLIIGNVWNVHSAKVAEKLNFQAIATSSSAIASMLGYQDGEEMRFSELEYIVNRIAKNTSLPLSVDLEAGYSRDPNEVVDHIKRLMNIGVVGINFEDSLVNENRILQDADEFAETLTMVVELLAKAKANVFINVRVDTFLLGHSDLIEETKKRIRLYEKAGADGVFIPCIESKRDIEMIVASTNLPVNVMCMPELPDFDTLQILGVKRISMGNYVFESVYGNLEKTLSNVLHTRSFNTIF